ncbi:hypothetical protein GEV33_001646 [Tenebrio molitor]|uniref:Uncharacterized protein n=1 Tax=Tenebrio molitor TaxID=7067 RepID=A0A8J6HUU0_TENMO|nr:hypothetical protein GEV33_001646 [Tenebrio molitor]
MLDSHQLLPHESEARGTSKTKLESAADLVIPAKNHRWILRIRASVTNLLSDPTLVAQLSVLLSNPNLPKLFGEALGSIETELALQTPRNKLMGRLELLVSQINYTGSPQDSQNDEALLVFTDKVSDSDDDVMEFDDHSNSENEWEEESSSGEENEKIDENENANGDDSDDDIS